MTRTDDPAPPEVPDSATEPAPNHTGDRILELSAITGGLAHEIRNSLSTLRMNLQLLEEDLQRAEDEHVDARETARRSHSRISAVLKESTRLETILEDFLNFVNKRELRTERYDLNNLIRELADFYRPQAEAHDIALTTESAGAPCWSEVDVNLMKQALLNLLINARQSMPEGGRLTIRLACENDRTIRIDVIDTGPGIEPDQHERIFRAYHSTRKGGTGLGLPTTRRIVREHGGKIYVRSKPPNGSCFTILLPRPV